MAELDQLLRERTLNEMMGSAEQQQLAIELKEPSCLMVAFLLRSVIPQVEARIRRWRLRACRPTWFWR